MKTRLHWKSLALFLGGICVVPHAHAQQSFSDVPSTHPAYAAVEYLKTQGIVSGYNDGTYQPEKSVNRAEAVKIIVGALIANDALSKNDSSPFTDVPGDAWFLPYVETARSRNIIDGPPKKTAFLGSNQVILVEFLKILETAYGVDAANTYSEIRLPLASDAQNPDEWFYPYLRYAMSASMVMIEKDGLLHPAKPLTRGETAILIHRFLMYREARRVQALLSEAETEIVVVLNMLENNDITQAEYASARALLAARGAHASKGDAPIVVGALKITESFRTLVRAYRAGVNQDFNEVVRLSKEAWDLAENAKSREASLTDLANQVQVIAGNMADSARESMGQ